MADLARLTRLYGTESAAKAQSLRYEKLKHTFFERFGPGDAIFVSAPGRTEIAGNHTDHNHGRVLAAAVSLDTVAAARVSGDTVVTLYSEGYDKPFVVDLNDLAPRDAEKETTNALIRGAAAVLTESGYRVGGFQACVTSTVLRGSGLSSSAAFEVLLIAIFDALFNGWTIDPAENARLSQKNENHFFGKPCGLMDQMACAVGGLVAIDFGSETAAVQKIQYDFAAKGYALCVVSAGGEHGNLTSEYAAIPEEMRAVARALGEDTLRTAEDRVEGAIGQLKGRVSDRAILRALHFVDENRRVGEMVSSLTQDRTADFLRGVIASGFSSWTLLQNLYVPGSANQEMPLALEMSRRMLNGRGAWRIHGGGFAGTILAFVPDDMLSAYSSAMSDVFGEGSVTVLSVRPEGVAWIR